MPGTVQLHRVFKAPPARVYRAFTDAAAMCKWLPPHGFTGTIHEIDVRVGGGYRMSFTNLGTGSSHSFSVKYVELKPGELIRHTDQFDDPNLPGENCTSPRKAFRTRFRSSSVTWAGRSRCCCWRSWSSRRFRTGRERCSV
jgi:uncharacterized protein YndB with AHSA1/START domain